jgi:tetratricopeptide (TPR) repeat protein
MNKHRAVRNRKFRIRPEFTVCILLIVITCSIFWKVIGHEFIIYDTPGYILNNPMVKQGLSWKGVGWAFTTFYMSNWHPVTWMSHMLDVQLFGLNAGWHHMVNLILHVINTLILFTTLRMMTRALWASAFVAVLFAIHPLHIESVAWVAERKDCLSTLFCLLAIRYFVGYVHRNSFTCYLLSLMSFSLGLMAKPMVVTLPFLLLLLDYWPMNRYAAYPLITNAKISVHSKPMRLLVMEKIPFFILATVSCIITFLAQQKGGSVGGIEQFPFWMRLANALTSYIDYCMKMIIPLELAVLYPYPVQFPLFKTFAAGLLLGFLSVIAVMKIRCRPWFSVGWFWYLGTMVPVIGIVQVGNQAMADRYTYIPSIGLFIMCAWWAFEIAEKSYRLRNIVWVTALTAVLVLATIASHQLNNWRNSVALFSHTLMVTDSHPLVNYFLGAALAESGKYDSAQYHYKKALKMNPGDELSHLNIGIIYQRRGKFKEAAGHYLKALYINPESWKAHHNLGLNLMAEENVDTAIEHFLKALKIAPESARAHNSLAVALIQTGDVKGAINHLEQALRLDPEYQSARQNLEKINR